MSDSEDSTVTYTQMCSPFVDLSDIGSPGVDGPPIMPDDLYAYVVAAFQAPPLPDYVPGPEEPQAPLPLDFVPEPSPGYIPKSDPEEDPEEDDEDPEEDLADYPADRDDDDREEEEPSGDDADDEDEDEDEEDEEHPASADSVPPVHCMTARISIRDEPSISLPPREEVERLLALTTPLSSPLPHIPSPPLPVSPPAFVLPALPPASPTHPLGCRVAMIRLRAETPSTSHPLPLPTSSPPLQLLSSDPGQTDPRLHYHLGRGWVLILVRDARAEEVGYGIRDVWVNLREAVEEVAPMTLEGVNTRVTELAAVQEQDTQDIYAVIEDTQDRQTQIYQRVETLVDDSQYHYETARLLDQEALVSREAWDAPWRLAIWHI
ncbi:hypothetical protein Tco_0651802 [Tanacetum coccineum]|uniref:Uncharacterized protein n=1 Tax=Tanacetum coccineum TaxID=301880 RepID=A0ABQ4WW24_9ASTR